MPNGSACTYFGMGIKYAQLSILFIAQHSTILKVDITQKCPYSGAPFKRALLIKQYYNIDLRFLRNLDSITKALTFVWPSVATLDSRPCSHYLDLI